MKQEKEDLKYHPTVPDVHLRYQSCDDCLVAGGDNLSTQN